MNEDTPDGACERTRLLLSLEADGAATPQHRAEIEAHLPRCAACRAAREADLAVRARLAERVGATPPSWLEGFARRTADLAIAQAREARVQNRILLMSAAAAALLAVTVQFVAGDAGLPAPANAPVTATAPVITILRDSTRVALLRAKRSHATDEGK